MTKIVLVADLCGGTLTSDKGGEVEINVKLVEESQDYPEPFSPNKLGTKKHQGTWILRHSFVLHRIG